MTNLPPGVLDPGLDHAVEQWCPCGCGRVVPLGMVCPEEEAARLREAAEDEADNDPIGEPKYPDA